MKKLSKKEEEENIKNKEKDEKKQELKETRMDPESKLKAYEKKKKMYRNFCVSKLKDNL